MAISTAKNSSTPVTEDETEAEKGSKDSWKCKGWPSEQSQSHRFGKRFFPQTLQYVVGCLRSPKLLGLFLVVFLWAVEVPKRSQEKEKTKQKQQGLQRVISFQKPCLTERRWHLQLWLGSSASIFPWGKHLFRLSTSNPEGLWFTPVWFSGSCTYFSETGTSSPALPRW